jgi:hypothetical protein
MDLTLVEIDLPVNRENLISPRSAAQGTAAASSREPFHGQEPDTPSQRQQIVDVAGVVPGGLALRTSSEAEHEEQAVDVDHTVPR